MSLLAHSIQVFEFNTSKSIASIREILERERNSGSQAYHRVTDVGESRGMVNCTLKIDTDTETLHYEVAIKPRENLLIVHGRGGTGRNNVNDFLAKVIENESKHNVIREHQLSVAQMLQLFDNITAENDRNIITFLKVYFEPLRGYGYARETYTELAYKFVDNRCASDHRDFRTLCNNGKRMYFSVALIQCTGIVDDIQNVPVRMDIKPNCSFRMYSFIPSDDWNRFCLKILNFL